MHDHLDIRPGRPGAPVGLNRRQALARLGLGASIVYVAPLLLSLGEARASGGSGGGEGGGGGSSGGSGEGGGSGSGAESSGPSGPSGADAGETDTGSSSDAIGTNGSTGVIGDATVDVTIVTDQDATLP